MLLLPDNKVYVYYAAVHLQPPEDEVCDHEGIDGKVDEDEKEEMIPPTPVPKEWDCLGSDLEIKEGFMEPGRPLVSVTCYYSELDFV